MCLAICHQLGERLVMTYFHEDKALLPVKTKEGEVNFFPWGRRKKENGSLPLGGWVDQIALNENKWSQYFPRPVKIMVKKFLEADIENQPYWFDVTEGQWIQGVFLQEKTEKRVYVVTFKPELPNNPFFRWPKINCL